MMTTASAVSPAPPVRRRSLPRHFELFAAAALAVAIAVTFWSAQRYPALLKKLHAGSAVKVSGAISFDALLPVRPEMPVPERIGRTAVNWLWTNRFGMYFALPFGAAAMTMLGRLNGRKQFGSATANIVCGSLVGMPAGVCTNCATPIAQGMLMGGTSTRLTMAALISSPSFNPVVVAMIFVLFPLKIAALRIAVPLVVLAFLPLLVKERKPAALGIAMPELMESVRTRVLGILRTFLKNLLRVTFATLPWMLLAAVLGAVAVELVPVYGTHLPVSLPGIVLVAALGTLLPVPMAFDAGLAWVLYKAGVPAPYVATLLCTLGIVSVYSLTALGQQLGRAVPLRLAALATVLGSLAGFVVLMSGR